MAFEYYAVDLPGKILYPKEFGAKIRRITPIEQKYILSLSQKQQRTNRDYISFLKKLVKFDNQEMQFEDLFWFDVQYLLYRIRFTTYEKYPIKLRFYCNEEDNEGNICTQEITGYSGESEPTFLMPTLPSHLPRRISSRNSKTAFPSLFLRRKRMRSPASRRQLRQKRR